MWLVATSWYPLNFSCCDLLESLAAAKHMRNTPTEYLIQGVIITVTFLSAVEKNAGQKLMLNNHTKYQKGTVICSFL